MGPGVSFECVEAQAGLHVNEDHFLAEIIDPETGAPLEDGDLGELVFTTLTKEGIPLLRYRTGDITRLNVEVCDCGRTFARMDRVSGRSDDMLIIRGVNVFPSQIESVLLMSPEVAPHYLLIVERQGAMDVLGVEVELTPEVFEQAKSAVLTADGRVALDEWEALNSLKKKIKGDIKDIVGVTVSVDFKEPGTIERSEGKAKRVLDKRPK
jgi:phenylacetate-CoA ligase